MPERYDRANLIGVVIPTDFEGGPVTVGVSAVEITFTERTKSISIQAASGNAGTIFVGKSDVTSAGAGAVCELAARQAITFDYNDADNAWYAVASQADQTIYKLALTINPDDMGY